MEGLFDDYPHTVTISNPLKSLSDIIYLLQLLHSLFLCVCLFVCLQYVFLGTALWITIKRSWCVHTFPETYIGSLVEKNKFRSLLSFEKGNSDCPAFFFVFYEQLLNVPFSHSSCNNEAKLDERVSHVCLFKATLFYFSELSCNTFFTRLVAPEETHQVLKLHVHVFMCDLQG